MNSKKGQLTLFIILGLILLILAGVLIYWYTLEPAITEKLPAIAVVPEEIKEVSDVFSSCLKENLEQALIQLGMHGGFLETKTFLHNSLSPTEAGANSIKLTRESSLILPYWWYLSNSNQCDRTGNCEFKQNKPSFTSIQQDLTKKLKEQIPICIALVQTMPGYEVKAKEQPFFDILFQKESISALVKYPLEIKKGEVVKTIDQFLAVVDLNLREILDLADTVTQYEAVSGFLGTFSYNIINYYMGLDENEIPPSNAYTFDFSAGKYWTKSKVKETVKTLLTSFTPFLKAGGTQNYQYIFAPKGLADPERFELLYNREFTLPLEKTFPSLKIRFVYLPDWEPYFDLDCNGELCLPESFLGKFNFVFGLQKYHFVYDLSFPVLVEITNPTALDGKGYSFRFFLEGNLRANKPLKTDTPPTSTFEETSNMMYCSPEQFTSPPVELSFIDRKTKQNIQNITVLYTCGTDTCNLGVARQGILNQPLPRCIGGLLTALKDNYATSYTLLDVEDEAVKEAVILEPYVKFNVKAERISLRKTPQGWIADEQGVVPLRDEHILIIMTRQSKENEDKYSALVELYGNPTREQKKTIEIIPGKYNIQVVSMLEPEKSLIIPKDERCWNIPKKKFPLKKEKECFYIPEKDIEFTKEQPFITSQFSYEWSITPQVLDAGREIIFPYPSIDIVSLSQENRKIEDISAVNIVQKIVEEKKTFYGPKIT
ncbi:hypothetical protein HYV79_04790 [Candidatus Woesearchaeota archaeon]|nr:hypothetical protein [Candidatus Woesearchaeota archaeon]